MEGCDGSLHSEMADNDRRVNASPTSNTLVLVVCGDNFSAESKVSSRPCHKPED